ncbi:MAG: DUF6804 family protein [Sphingomicrobium sp.]
MLTGKLVWWIPIAALTLALFELPYTYYVLLRIVVCGACAYLAFSEADAGRIRWAWILGSAAVLYNPILRIHLNRELWSMINLATIWLVAVHMWSHGRTKTNQA